MRRWPAGPEWSRARSFFLQLEKVAGPIGVLVRGGNELEVGFEKDGDQFKHVTLTGPADFVFEGTIEL